MSDAGRDTVIWGVTRAGRRFRPSDWSERLAGLTAAFGQERKLAYSPLVLPVSIRGLPAVVVGRTLSTLEPRFYQFLVNFANDNELVLEWHADALLRHQELPPPPGAGSGGAAEAG